MQEPGHRIAGECQPEGANKMNAQPFTQGFVGHVFVMAALAVTAHGTILCWDGKPYVRVGFTGNGDLARMLKAGFTQFTLAPDEKWPISGPDAKIVQSVNETSDRLEKAGATYYGSLNAFWPWRYGTLIAESDKAAVFVRSVRDVTEHAGRHWAADLQIRVPVPPAERDNGRRALRLGARHALRSERSSGECR
jgi:hypothetical protein